jgi:hypothetical protein
MTQQLLLLVTGFVLTKVGGALGSWLRRRAWAHQHEIQRRDEEHQRVVQRRGEEHQRALKTFEKVSQLRAGLPAGTAMARESPSGAASYCHAGLARLGIIKKGPVPDKLPVLRLP